VNDGCTRLPDTWYDTFRGVVMLARIWQGKMKRGDIITMKSTGKKYEIQELGIMHPELVPVSSLNAGQVGCIIANVKTPIEARVGDTIVLDVDTPALLGFDPPASMVFAGIYPMDASEFDLLDKAMDKLTLNDASVSCIKESSNALGLGFRCGFLGLLHMDVFRQRLEQEFNADIIITSPTVPFKARLVRGSYFQISARCSIDCIKMRIKLTCRELRQIRTTKSSCPTLRSSLTPPR